MAARVADEEDLDSRTASVGAAAPESSSQPTSRKSSLSKRQKKQRKRNKNALASANDGAASAPDSPVVESTGGGGGGGDGDGDGDAIQVAIPNTNTSDNPNITAPAGNTSPTDRVDTGNNSNNNNGDSFPSTTGHSHPSIPAEDAKSNSPDNGSSGTANTVSPSNAQEAAALNVAPNSASTDASLQKKTRSRKASRKQSAKEDGTKKEARVASAGSFQAVNTAYWRSRSASTSSSEGGANAEQRADSGNKAEQHRAVRVPSTGGSTHLIFVDDSSAEAKAQNKAVRNAKDAGKDESSDSDDDAVSEGGDEMMINVDATENSRRPSQPAQPAESAQHIEPVSQQNQNQSQPQDQVQGQPPPSGNVPTDERRNMAFHLLRSTYPTPPSTLVDLSQEHIEIQAKYFYYHTPLADLDLNLPIRCIECTKEGHLAQVCPLKECKHCGAWEAHDSRFCPTYRRCWNCRGRGHDQHECAEEKRFSHEVPCDFCGDPRHIEMQCDLLWKPVYEREKPETIEVSTSCAYCADGRHLIGDCTKRSFAMDTSSTWTLRDVDPKSVVKLNTIFPKSSGNKKSAAQYESDDSQSPDDFGNNAFENRLGKNNRGPPPPPPPPPQSQQHRGNIKIDAGIGRSLSFTQDNTYRNGNGNADGMRSRSRSPVGAKYPVRARSHPGGPSSYGRGGGGRGSGAKRNGKWRDSTGR